MFQLAESLFLKPEYPELVIPGKENTRFYFIMSISFELIWFDSLGAKSSCTLVKTPDVSVLITLLESSG